MMKTDDGQGLCACGVPWKDVPFGHFRYLYSDDDGEQEWKCEGGELPSISPEQFFRASSEINKSLMQVQGELSFRLNAFGAEFMRILAESVLLANVNIKALNKAMRGSKPRNRRKKKKLLKKQWAKLLDEGKVE